MGDSKLRAELESKVRRAIKKVDQDSPWYRRRVCREQFIPSGLTNRGRKKHMNMLNSIFRQLASEGLLFGTRERNFFKATEGHFEPKFWGIRL